MVKRIYMEKNAHSNEPPKKKRKRQSVKHRVNTSAVAMFPYEVAEQLLISEAEVYKLMAIGPEHGGIRAICLGDVNSARPRKIVLRVDLDAFIEKKTGQKGLFTAQLAAKAAADKAPSQVICAWWTRAVQAVGLPSCSPGAVCGTGEKGGVKTDSK
jgi:hypothetical protein